MLRIDEPLLMLRIDELEPELLMLEPMLELRDVDEPLKLRVVELEPDIDLVPKLWVLPPTVVRVLLSRVLLVAPVLR